MAKKLHEKPILTIDVAYVSWGMDGLQVLLFEREKPPCKGRFTLPGGFIRCDEDPDLDQSAERIIDARARILPDYIEQIETVGSSKRDPRGWSATILYIALVSQSKIDLNNGTPDAEWIAFTKLPTLKLGFDHDRLLTKVFERYQSKSRYTSLPLYLLPNEFSLTEAQTCFEISIGAELEKKSFRRRLLSADLIEETGKSVKSGKRNAALYRTRKNHEIFFFPRMIG